MTSRPILVEEAIIEKLVETNQLLTNVNKLIEPSTTSTDKVEFIQLPKDSILPKWFRFIDLFILPDVFSLLACQSCSTTNTLKLLDIEDKKKQIARFMQIKFRDCEFKHSFYTSPKIDNTKDNLAQEWKLRRSMLGLYAVSEVSGLAIHHWLSCVVSWTCHYQWPKFIWWPILFDKGCI